MMSIEIKDNDDDAILKTIELCRKYDRLHSTCIGGEASVITNKCL